VPIAKQSSNRDCEAAIIGNRPEAMVMAAIGQFAEHSVLANEILPQSCESVPEEPLRARSDQFAKEISEEIENKG
jgi:hypothetical protein